jgi:hypothetical protein
LQQQQKEEGIEEVEEIGRDKLNEGLEKESTVKRRKEMTRNNELLFTELQEVLKCRGVKLITPASHGDKKT